MGRGLTNSNAILLFRSKSEHTEPQKEHEKRRPELYGKDVREFLILLREQKIVARNRQAK